MTPVRRFVLLAVCLALGCAPEPEVRRYTVPAEAVPQVEVSAKPEAAKSRLLGLIAPSPGGKSWFVKLAGDPPTIAAAKPAFDRFVNSLRFDASGPGKLPGFEMPVGWSEGKNDPISLAAFEVPGADGGAPARLTLSEAGGDLNDNVKRWRGQIGLLPLPAGDAANSYSQSTVNGRPVYLIDLYGPKPAGGMGAAPFAPKMR